MSKNNTTTGTHICNQTCSNSEYVPLILGFGVTAFTIYAGFVGLTLESEVLSLLTQDSPNPNGTLPLCDNDIPLEARISFNSIRFQLSIAAFVIGIFSAFGLLIGIMAELQHGTYEEIGVWHMGAMLGNILLFFRVALSTNGCCTELSVIDYATTLICVFLPLISAAFDDLEWDDSNNKYKYDYDGATYAGHLMAYAIGIMFALPSVLRNSLTPDYLVMISLVGGLALFLNSVTAVVLFEEDLSFTSGSTWYRVSIYPLFMCLTIYWYYALGFTHQILPEVDTLCNAQYLFGVLLIVHVLPLVVKVLVLCRRFLCRR